MSRLNHEPDNQPREEEQNTPLDTTKADKLGMPQQDTEDATTTVTPDYEDGYDINADESGDDEPKHSKKARFFAAVVAAVAVGTGLLVDHAIGNTPNEVTAVTSHAFNPNPSPEATSSPNTLNSPDPTATPVQTANAETSAPRTLTPVLMTGSSIQELYPKLAQNLECIRNASVDNQLACVSYMIGDQLQSPDLFSQYWTIAQQIDGIRNSQPNYNQDLNIEYVDGSPVNGTLEILTKQTENNNTVYIKYTLFPVAPARLEAAGVPVPFPLPAWLYVVTGQEVSNNPIAVG